MTTKIPEFYAHTVGISDGVVLLYRPDAPANERIVSIGVVYRQGSHLGVEPYRNIIMTPRVLRMVASALEAYATTPAPGMPVFIEDGTDGDE